MKSKGYRNSPNNFEKRKKVEGLSLPASSIAMKEPEKYEIDQSINKQINAIEENPENRPIHLRSIEF